MKRNNQLLLCEAPKRGRTVAEGWAGAVMQKPLVIQQVTRGHNIVADGWAGASNPHPHPTPTPHLNLHKKYLKCSFFHFPTQLPQTEGPTDRRIKPFIELRDRN